MNASGGSAAGGSGGSAVGGSAGAAGNGGSGCLEPPLSLEPLSPAIEFLIDSSGSLREPWVDDTSRWRFVRDALIDAFSSMPPATAPGLVFFPNVQWSAGIEGEGDDFCLLTYEAAPIAELGDQHRSELVEAVQRQPTLGATPTYDAYEYAISLLAAHAERRAKVLLLVTDGAPTYADGCVGDGVTPVDGGPLADVARAAFVTHGVRTFVLGISGGFESLSEMALAGGTGRTGCDTRAGYACHFDASTSESPARYLASALSIVQREARRCVFAATELAPELPDASVFRLVSPDGAATLLPQVEPASPCTRGVVYHRESGVYALCPETCSEFAENPDLRAELHVGCVDPLFSPDLP